MIGREAGRNTLQRLAVVADAAEGVGEGRIFDDRPEARLVADDPVAEGRQPGRVRVPDAATDVDLAGLEVEVAAARVDVLIVGPAARVVDAVTGPGEAC